MDCIRKKGKEFGATTGRPRRCGWFDAVLARYSVMVNGINEIAVTKLDVLDDLEEIKICTGYKMGGKIIKNFPACTKALFTAKPVYETHPGWKSDTTQAKRYSDLPVNARKYLKRLSQLLSVPITILSVGSHENQTLWMGKNK
jgi:adenylosuccinate synthase